MAANDDPFKGFNDSRPTRGVYVEPGVYDVTVKSCKMVKGWNSEFSFVTELLIDSTTNPTRPVGSEMSWVCAFKHASALSNVREFLAQATGSRFEDITDEAARGAVSEQNPLKGTKLHLTATHVKTTKGGNFTKCAWTLIPEAA